jgi:putative transposase
MLTNVREVKHYDDEQQAHFLTFSCFHQLPLLSKERTCRWFVRAIEKARIKYQFHLWAWVAMPDHAHMVIWPTLPKTRMKDVLHSIKGFVGRRAMHYLRLRAPIFMEKLTLVVAGKVEYHFWQDGPGHDRNLEDAPAIHESIRYTHENPLKAGLVARVEDWEYSSARAWAGDANPILRIDFDSVPRWVQ